MATKAVLTAEVKGTMEQNADVLKAQVEGAVRQGSCTGYSLEMIKIFIENSNK